MVGLSAEARAIEAVLIVAVEPVAPGLLAELLELPIELIEPRCEELAESCRAGNRGFEVARIAGG
ncbi:MAG: SMC-Scp complex subunit ScpB, partial [Acidimicrobiales bacterium]